LAPDRPLYVSMSRLRVPAERAPELVRAFRGRAHLVDDAAGFVDLEVWQSDRDPGELIMVSRWRDRAAFRDYMRSPEHKASHDRIPADLDDAIELERLEHLHTYEVVGW
jgi:heme-degrading monooxygenase HmoA